MYNLQLETFIAVADAGSFNKAAEQLYVTPTAVIKQINHLEKRLDLKLFNRSPRGLILTKSGESLYNDAKYLIQYSRDSLARAKRAGIPEEIIRIGTSPLTPPQILVDLWPKIHEVAPSIKFQLVPFDNTPENAREILKNLGQNYDIIVGVFDDVLMNLRECNGFKLSEKPFACALPFNHPLVDRKFITLDDLSGETLLMIRKDWSHYVDDLRSEIEGSYPDIQIKSFDFYNLDIFNQAANTNTPLMVFDNWQGVHPLLKTVPLKWEKQMPLGLIYSLNPSEKVKNVLEVIAKLVQSGRINL